MKPSTVPSIVNFKSEKADKEYNENCGMYLHTITIHITSSFCVRNHHFQLRRKSFGIAGRNWSYNWNEKFVALAYKVKSAVSELKSSDNICKVGCNCKPTILFSFLTQHMDFNWRSLFIRYRGEYTMWQSDTKYIA